MDPLYPEVAKRMNLGGVVKVVAVVATDGSVKKVEAGGRQPAPGSGRGKRHLTVEVCSRAGVQGAGRAALHALDPLSGCRVADC